MAMLAISAAGAWVGSSLGLGVAALGLSGAQVGWALGSLLGSQLFGKNVQGPKLSDLKIAATDPGTPIQFIRGTERVAGTIIAASKKIEHEHEESAGKGGGSSATSYTYSIHLLIALADNQTHSLGRAWKDGKQIYDGRSSSEAWADIRFYDGAPDQMPDPLYESLVGTENAPAYRGRSTIMIEHFDLGGGGYMSNLTFELNSSPAVHVPNSVLVACYSCNSAYDTVSGGAFHITNTGAPTYSDYFGEFGSSALLYYSTVDPGDSGVLGGKTLPIDSTSQYFLELNNTCSPSDYCRADFEFLNASGSVVCAISTPGTGTYSHVLSYGSSLFSLTATGQAGAYPITGGNLSFSSGALTFTNTRGANYNKGFTFSCAATTITQVRVSNVRVSENYAGSLSVASIVRLQKIGYSIGGEVGTDLIRDTVDALLDRAGFAPEEYNTAELDAVTQPMRGIAVPGAQATRPSLEMLMSAFQLDCRESGGKLQFIPRATTSLVTIDSSELIDTGTPPQVTIGNELELPARVSISFSDVLNDYQVGTAFSDRLNSQQLSINNTQLALVMLPTEARKSADTLLMDSLAMLTNATVALPTKYGYLEPADIFTLVMWDGENVDLRITSRKDNGAYHEFECVAHFNAALQSTGAADGTDYSTTVAYTASTLWRPMDMPLISDSHNAPGYWVACAPDADGTVWHGATLFGAYDDVNYSTLNLVPIASVLGTCSTTLADWTGGNVFDMASLLTVDVGNSGTLASVPRATLFADLTVNNMMVGSEWVRYLNAELVTTGVYILSGFLRGQRGTEWAMTGHVASDPCTTVTASLVRVSETTAQIGSPRWLKAVTAGRPVDAVTGVSFTDTGIALKPFAPIHGRSLWSGADKTITWQPRTRVSTRFAASGLADAAPIGEASEAYVLRIYSGVTLKRTENLTSPSYTYTAANSAADGFTTGATMTIKVTQVSATVGEGYTLTFTSEAP